MFVYKCPSSLKNEPRYFIDLITHPKLTITSDLFPQKTCTGRCQVLISLKRPIRQVAWAIGNTLNDVSQLARPLFSKSQRTFQNEITSSSIASRSFPQNFQIVFYSNFSHENISWFFSKVLLCVLIVYYLPNFYFYRWYSIANLVYFIYHRKIYLNFTSTQIWLFFQFFFSHILTYLSVFW